MSVNYQDPLSWSLELEKHFCGDVSSASVQSHLRIEDKLQIDCCSKATFIGLYDGFKGDEASSYLRECFFPSLL
ncbi:putative protein phosphatase 2C 68-like, partial [Trifolium medium]|nr:putative protein phosphatase 2C 68-like [Trifolium medium]